MARIRVIRSNPQVSNADIASAILAATDLDAEEANALARGVSEAPTTVEGSGKSMLMLHRIANVLRQNGYEVAFDA